RGVREWRQLWQVQVVGSSELVQFDQGLSDFGGAGVLIAFLGEGLPEGDHVLVDHDWLIDIHGTYGWVIDGFEPSGHVNGLAYLIGISTGTGYPGNDGGP